jgi:sterol desaturase/sphingolipid hydroxylase (fatty acid hydroxylase superfamily)
MGSFNTISAIVMLTVSITEIIFVIINSPDKKLIRDVKTNMLLGLLYFLAGMSVKVFAFGVFSLFYHYAIFKPALSWWLWIVGFLGCDFMHYIYHRLGHKTRIFWAPHVTHHSSLYFNMSSGYRNNFFHVLYRFLFWAPLCLLGIPPTVVLVIESITAIQNFIVHTEKIGKLGVLDWIFNTPSNHRVHHGINPEYIDKNLGGVLMIYDHLFRTYAREEAPPIYGITHNINSEDPYKIITHEYLHLIRELPKINGVSNKIKYLFSPPD